MTIEEEKCPTDGCGGRLYCESYADVWAEDPDGTEWEEEFFVLVCDKCGYEEDV